VDRSKVTPPALTDVWVSTEPKNVVKFEDNQIWPLRVEKWLLFKEVSGNFTKIDSSNFNLTVLNDTATVVKSEAYKVAYKDECNSTSILSPEVKSLYLDYSLPALLRWTKEPQFSRSAVSQFAVIPFKETDNSPLPAKIVDKNSFSTQADLDAFEENAKFRIEATSTLNPKRISLSNIVKIPISPVIYLPTTFTPNGDGENDLLAVKGKTKRMDSFFNENLQQIG
jgi:hypothetical protein